MTNAGPSSNSPVTHEGQANPDPRRLIVLGSTGSIGVNTLAVAEHLTAQGRPIEVVGLAAGRSVETLIEQAQRHRPRFVAIAETCHADELAAALPGIEVFAGPDAAERLIRVATERAEVTDVAAAIVGIAGLAPTLAAAELGLRIHLSNKETLVAAGALIAPAVQRGGGELIPVDSEHSAIFQCLVGQPHQAVRRIVLTASGGPFRNVDADAIADATVEQALAHPTWKMGQKVTIDSASMMNKALEVIEAHWLFGLPGNQIDAIIHPQSIVHSFVEFTDASVLAQLGPPDMKTPIHYALTHPDRVAGCGEAMDWRSLSELTFEPPDPQRFPALGLAYDAIETGGTGGAILNAANEAAVDAFLDRRIRFGRIPSLVAEALAEIEATPAESLQAVYAADRRAREFVHERLATSRTKV